MSDIETLLQNAIDEAYVDKHRYEIETEVTLRQRRDPNYTMVS